MFQVLPSSAGAGKTHALVKHYLGLALQDENPAGYARILALTFTNKAAAEMRERILRYLNGLATDTEPTGALRDVQATITAERGIPPEVLRTRALRTRDHMLHHWPQLAVSTIDAFTRRVVMPFARDLRLDSELRMTTEEAWYRDRAVDQLLGSAGADPRLTDLLAAICEELIEQERAWRVDVPLRDLSMELGRERSIAHLERLRSIGHERFIAMRTELRERTTAFREHIRALGGEALAAIEREHIDLADLAHGSKGVASYYRALVKFDTWLEEKPRARTIIDSGKWSSAKASAAAKAAIDKVMPRLADIMEQVESLRATGELQRHAVSCAVLRDLLPSAALHLLDEQLEAIKREEGVAFFSDLVRKVAGIVQHEPAPFLYERLGERYQHFLIDEFQDTSTLQWRSLLPLLTNALSGEGSALLVGDAKQAIYRWRNGEARQFSELPRVFGKDEFATGQEHEDILQRTHRPKEPLAQNHRSARGIIRFNNELFDALRDQLHEEDRAVFSGAAQEAVKEYEGYVHLCCVDRPVAGKEDEPEEPDDDGTMTEIPAPVRFALRSVAEAIADGSRPGDIAVLVRSGTQGRAIAQRLNEAGHHVVSPDGLSLGTAPTVQAIMCVFAWCHRPDDATAALAVQRIAMLAGAGANGTDPFVDRAPAIIMGEWSASHPRVRSREPLLSSLRTICGALGIDPAQDAFVMRLLDEALAFLHEHGDDPGMFLDHWHRMETKLAVSAADDPDAVRVMTVHKSKGLQFPVVIVPWADMDTRNANDHVWIDAHDILADLPAALVRSSKDLEAVGLSEVLAEQRANALDRLNLLYVAFTRPETRLYACIDGKKRSGLAAALRNHFGLAAGEEKTFGQRSKAPERALEKEPVGRPLAPSPAYRPPALRVRSDAPDDWDPADPDPFRSHGRAMHAVLARVRVPQDIDAAIDAELSGLLLTGAERTTIQARLADLLRLPSCAPYFAEGLHVRTEVTLIDALGHAHRPDRIVRDGEHTHVIDFKTGLPSESHIEQVRHYARLLRELGEQRVSGHVLYVRDGTVVDVEP